MKLVNKGGKLKGNIRNKASVPIKADGPSNSCALPQNGIDWKLNAQGEQGFRGYPNYASDTMIAGNASYVRTLNNCLLYFNFVKYINRIMSSDDQGPLVFSARDVLGYIRHVIFSLEVCV